MAGQKRATSRKPHYKAYDHHKNKVRRIGSHLRRQPNDAVSEARLLHYQDNTAVKFKNRKKKED
jgi:hypothetical protein